MLAGCCSSQKTFETVLLLCVVLGLWKEMLLSIFVTVMFWGASHISCLPPAREIDLHVSRISLQNAIFFFFSKVSGLLTGDNCWHILCFTYML